MSSSSSSTSLPNAHTFYHRYSVAVTSVTIGAYHNCWQILELFLDQSQKYTYEIWWIPAAVTLLLFLFLLFQYLLCNFFFLSVVNQVIFIHCSFKRTSLIMSYARYRQYQKEERKKEMKIKKKIKKKKKIYALQNFIFLVSFTTPKKKLLLPIIFFLDFHVTLPLISISAFLFLSLMLLAFKTLTQRPNKAKFKIPSKRCNL